MATTEEQLEELRQEVNRLLSISRLPYRPPGVVFMDEGTTGDDTGIIGRKRRADFRGPGVVVTDGDDRAIITIEGVGVGFCYDYLVDEGYTGTEGATFSVPQSTHTFKRYTTVEGATDDGIATFSRAFSVFVCPGTYVEDLEIADFSHEIHIHGTGADAVIIGGNTVSSHSFKTATVYLRDLTLTGPAAGYSLTSGASENCKIHATNVIFRRRMAGDHAGSEFYNCAWPAGIQFEANDTPDTVLIVGGLLSSATGLDFTVATGSKANWDVRGLRMNTGATLKLRQVSNSRFNIHFETDGGSLNDQVAFSDEDSAGVVLDCHFAPMGNGGQVISVEAGREIHNLQVRGIAQYGTGIADNATRWFDNDGIVVGAHIDVSHRRNSSGNRLEDDITGPSYEGDFRECKFTLTPTDVEILTDGSSTGNVVDSGTIQSGSVGISSSKNLVEIDLGSALDGVPLVA